MIRCDALVVGGGPAGSTCARVLQRAGWDVIVLDRARFPRDKVCGGWLTPQVFVLLELDPSEYRATGRTLQDITGFRTCALGARAGWEETSALGPLETRYGEVVSYAIRRCEFDEFLLHRSGARIVDGTPLTSFVRDRDMWIVNDAFETPFLVGAGGHFCPVARQLQGHRDAAPPVVAKELEARIEPGETSVAAEVPELFFCSDFEGYGWCVRKGDFLNVGIGRRDATDFARHVEAFASFLVASGRAPRSALRQWPGHAYHAMGAGVRPLWADGVVVVGDAAGLAYPESGEGIRPAIESGRLAAEALLAARAGNPRAFEAYGQAIRSLHRPHRQTPLLLRPLSRFVGRTLLRHSPRFTKRVMLDRWFLRREAEGRSAG